MSHDYVTKRARLKEYAERGDVYSQYELAMSYCCGNQSWHDNEQGLKWLCTAAKNGHSKSQLELGKLYQNVNEINPPPVKTDLVKAYFWYSVADRYLSFEAKEAKSELEGNLKPQQIQKVKEMLKNWRNVSCG